MDADFNLLKDTNTAQFAENRVAELFKPGTYAVTANVGFYQSVAGLGLNPDDVMINGDVTVDAFNSEDAGNATQNFWRSAENLAITPSSGTDRGQSPRRLRSAASMSMVGSTSTRPAMATPVAATLPTPRSPARWPVPPSSSGIPGTVISAAGMARFGTWSSRASPVLRARASPLRQ